MVDEINFADISECYVQIQKNRPYHSRQINGQQGEISRTTCWHPFYVETRFLVKSSPDLS